MMVTKNEFAQTLPDWSRFRVHSPEFPVQRLRSATHHLGSYTIGRNCDGGRSLGNGDRFIDTKSVRNFSGLRSGEETELAIR